MRAWELFRQAIVGAARARLRSTLTATGIAIGCGALVSMVAFALGLQEQMEKPFRQLGLLNDIRVSAARDDAASGARLDDAALAKFRDLAGVKYAYPEIRLADIGVEHGPQKANATAIAAPREAGLTDQIGSLLSAGEYFSLDDAPQIILSGGLATRLGFENAAAAVDQSVVVTAAGLATDEHVGQFKFENKRVEVRIVGVFEAPTFGPFGGRGAEAALIPVDLMQHLPGLVESQLGAMRREGDAAAGGYRRVIVRAESPAEVERIAREIDAAGFHTRTMLSELKDARAAFLFIKSLLTAVGSVAMIIAGLGIANTLLMTVLERYEEIGLYKAIGATDGDVRLLFLSEAAVLGLVGGVLGLALAGVVCWGLQWAITAYLRSEGVERAVDAFAFPWWLLTGGVAFSLVVSIISGLYPASRAARVEPIEALRHG